MNDLSPPPIKHSWDRPAGASFEQWMKSRVARVAERAYDWNAFKFQADFDPKYRRAQKRFIGTGGTGVASDSNVIPAEHFTLSNMILPVGAEGPMHLHTDAEEVFFVLRGRIKVMVETGRRNLRDRARRTRLHLGAAGPLSRRGQCRRGGGDHHGDDRLAQACHADLSGRSSAGQGQARLSARRSGRPIIILAGGNSPWLSLRHRRRHLRRLRHGRSQAFPRRLGHQAGLSRPTTTCLRDPRRRRGYRPPDQIARSAAADRARQHRARSDLGRRRAKLSWPARWTRLQRGGELPDRRRWLAADHRSQRTVPRLPRHPAHAPSR